MAKQFLKITSLTNEDGNDMFNAICKDVLHQKSSEVRLKLGLPPAQKVTTKDLVTLIQENGLEANLVVYYDPEKQVTDKKPDIKLDTASETKTPNGESGKGEDDLPF